MIQKLIPHIFLTFLLSFLANSKIRVVKGTLIKAFIAFYKPNLDEAIHKNINEYSSYNDFFTRRLRAGARKIDHSERVIISPVDGEIVDHGFVRKGQLIQAKKYEYDLEDLTGEGYSTEFENSYFITLYLAPTDYHRIHCPFDAEISNSLHLGTSLFSVNKNAQKSIPNLYVKNERSVLHLVSDNLKYLLISVGASVVGSIVPFWSTNEKSTRSELIKEWQRGPKERKLIKKGEELAHFRMGSTVILIFKDPDILDLDSLKENKLVKFGSELIKLKTI